MSSLTPLRDEAGTVVGALAICKDLSTRVQLEREAARLAILQERERIAMDLHDGAIQSLYAVALGLTACLRAVGELPPEGRAALERARGEVSAVIQEIRGSIAQLRPSPVARPLLRAGLESLAEELRLGVGLRVELDLSPRAESVLDVQTSANLLQICREAASNVARHAGASKLRIGLVRARRALVMSVSDDGQGFDARRVGRRRGDGLRNMATRARLAGGQLTVSSRLGPGTLVRVRLPLPTRG